MASFEEMLPTPIFSCNCFRPNKDKVVTLAHTFESLPFGRDENMRVQEGTGRPDIADVYMNRFKGVDIHDQYCAFLEWPFITYRWRTLASIHLLQKIIIDGFLMWKEDNFGTRVGVKQYAEMVADEIKSEHFPQLIQI